MSSDYSLCVASPVTGKLHQIRAHLAHLNHPIVGDDLYARSSPSYQPRAAKERQEHRLLQGSNDFDIDDTSLFDYKDLFTISQTLIPTSLSLYLFLSRHRLPFSLFVYI